MRFRYSVITKQTVMELRVFLGVFLCLLGRGLAADYCHVEGTRTDCHPETGANEDTCHNRGCCWRPPDSEDSSIPWCYRFSLSLDGLCSVDGAHRLDCGAGHTSTPTSCLSRGCCWQPPENGDQSIPWCFHPASSHIAVCDLDPTVREDCFPGGNANQTSCMGRGCCWRRPAANNHGTPWCYRTSAQCSVDDVRRADCHPEPDANAAACLARGCCWKATSTAGVPFCFYGSTHTGYTTGSPKNTSTSLTALLQKTNSTHWPREISYLNMSIAVETNSRLRFKLTDADSKRYEVSFNHPPLTNRASNPDYDVRVTNSPAGVVVTRRSTGSTLFDTSISPIVYSDQFIQIKVAVPSRYLYGFGEHRQQFLIDPSTSPTFAFWSRDQPPNTNANLYGVHPFFLGLEDNGKAFGVFLLNSNAMEVRIFPTTPTTMVYRTIGGVLDFYIFTGPTPDDVISQYSEVIGKTHFPPYWALGFHLCRWGYNGNSGLKTVIQNMRNARMPYESQWIDIDYMQNNRDWTYDRQAYSELPDIARDLHSHGQKFVAMLDPGINNEQPTGSYLPYDDGITEGIFIKTHDGHTPLIGKVWPGTTTFPDFTHPRIQQYWDKHNRLFHRLVPFDGLWIDMNEPASFADGSTSGCTGNRWDNPPYTPGITDRDLKKKTICPSASQYAGKHYDLHNLYGYHEAIVTKKTMDALFGKRTLILSRSSFAGSGQHTAHWTGDNRASWSDLYYSIPAILNFNMFGIPLVGADICGFSGDVDEELCTRWMQLGSFYPFMRNHQDNIAAEHHPASSRFPNHQDKMKASLDMRYSLLPYFYTLFFKSHTEGTPVVRPLFFEFVNDLVARRIDKQFLWGRHLLITPVLKQGATSVNAYFPSDRWYDYFSGHVTSTGGRVTLSAPIDKINVHVRAGIIIPTQNPDVTTTTSRQNPFGLVVALPTTGIARGELFWDDGESYGMYRPILENYKQSLLELRVAVLRAGYSTTMTLGKVSVFGLMAPPNQITLNRQVIPRSNYTYDATNKVLHVTNLSANLLQAQQLTWTSLPVG
ncbi:hypothetical protein ScPMuIL_003239 [Solemya velum]